MGLESRLRHIELKIGVLVIIAVLFTVVGVVYVGYKKELFAHRIRYYVYSSTGERLFEGIPVKFEGFRMGEVSKVELNENGIIVLTLEVLQKYQRWVKNNSRVFFNQESMIGSPYLRFTKGAPEKPEMPEGSVFILEFEGGIDEIIKRAKPVMEDVAQIVENVRKLSDDISSEQGDLKRFLAHLKNVSYKLEHGDGALPYLIYRDESKIKFENILDRFTEIEERINSLGKNLNSTVTDRVDPILDDVSKTTKDLYLLRRKADYTLNLGNDVLFKLNNTWPIASESKAKETPELPNP